MIVEKINLEFSVSLFFFPLHPNSSVAVSFDFGAKAFGFKPGRRDRVAEKDKFSKVSVLNILAKAHFPSYTLDAEIHVVSSCKVRKHFVLSYFSFNDVSLLCLMSCNIRDLSLSVLGTLVYFCYNLNIDIKTLSRENSEVTQLLSFSFQPFSVVLQRVILFRGQSKLVSFLALNYENVGIDGRAAIDAIVFSRNVIVDGSYSLGTLKHVFVYSSLISM